MMEVAGSIPAVGFRVNIGERGSVNLCACGAVMVRRDPCKVEIVGSIPTIGLCRWQMRITTSPSMSVFGVSSKKIKRYSTSWPEN